MEHVLTAVRAAPAPQRRIKDAPTRAAHWWMAACFVGAYVTGDSESLRLWHVIFGYGLMLALGFRILWGFFGPQPVRPGNWWRRGKAGAQWLLAQLRPSAWKQWMTQPAPVARQGLVQMSALAMALMVAALPWIGLSGYVTYNELAGDWMEELHEWLGNLALGLVLLHVGLLLFGSLVRRQNLAQPMLSGTMPGKGPDLAPRNHLWLALLLSICMLGFAGAYWSTTVEQLPAAQATLQQAQLVGDDD